MGNSLSQTASPRNNAHFSSTTTPRNCKLSTYRRKHLETNPNDESYHHRSYKSKSLPTRRGNEVSSHPDSPDDKGKSSSSQQNGETSRVLFLLYLIHRTWNVVVDTVDTKSKRSRRSSPSEQNQSIPTPTPYMDELCCYDNDAGCSITITDINDLDDRSSICCSQYSNSSCSYCQYDQNQNFYNSIADIDNDSIDSIYNRDFSTCDSDFSAFYYQHHQGYQMAPSVCQNSPKLTPHNVAATATTVTTAGSTAVAMANSTTTNTTISGIRGNNNNNHSSSNSNNNLQICSTSLTQKSNNSVGSSMNGSIASYKMNCSENSWPQAVFSKENQRPPVYNPEDYVQSLKKFGKRQSGTNPRSIYDASDTQNDENYKSSTLPNKHAEYKSPIPSPPGNDPEMSLRQFASVTDLLTKLRADLRVSFPSFVQEFVATPSDGVSLLLEVLRAIQLSQAVNAPLPLAQMTNSMPRNPQTYQRRALLDELACLQCLSICCQRSIEATARLGSTPVGLMPLASSATGQGIRARILALQLMSAACDKQVFGPGSQKIIAAGHTAVSEAMSTLRLRCSEPVRFRLFIGMLNSGGGSGELQAVGVKFINTFLESSESLQQRLYLQAELFQAGFEPGSLTKTISSSSPWLDILRNELKRFNEIYVDVDKMITQAREADRVRSQMVILERRVQILHEEKAVLTSMERRLQERCAELQREIFRLQGAQNPNNFKSLDKQPVALPRHVPPKQDSSEHEDEGISSSETGPSLSPVPILVLPQKSSQLRQSATSRSTFGDKQKKKQEKDEDSATIEEVMEELNNIVTEAEKEIISKEGTREKEIVPVNIVPQPPRKARSLAYLVSPQDGSDLDGSEYGMLLMQNQNEQAAVDRVTNMQTFFDEADYELPEADKPFMIDSPDLNEVNPKTTALNASTTRELLDVIMNARHNDNDPTINALRNNAHNIQHNKRHSCASIDHLKAVGPPPIPKKPQAPAQQFNGVFFMTGMNTPQKYPKPDITAALQARCVTKNLERLEAAFASHESLTDQNHNSAGVVIREKSRSNQQIYFGSNPTLRLNTNYNSFTNNITVVTNTNKNISSRTRSYTHGSKVTDTPSGLY